MVMHEDETPAEGRPADGADMAVDVTAGWIAREDGNSDEELLERLRQGEQAAFDTLFLRYYRQVYRVLYSVVGNAQEAEDLLQETLLVLYRQPPKLDRGAPLAAWLYRVAANRGYNALRATRRDSVRPVESVEQATSVDPHTEAVRAEERARVRAALARQPERAAKLLLLRAAGLSYAEIAAALEIALGSVGTLLARAERAFLKEYEAQSAEEREEG